MQYGNISFISGCYTNIFMTRKPVTHVRFLLRSFVTWVGYSAWSYYSFSVRRRYSSLDLFLCLWSEKKFKSLSVPIFYYDSFNLAWKYTRRRKYVIKPPWKDLNSFIKFFQVLKIHVEMRTCRPFCSCNDLFHAFTSALTELSRKLFNIQRPELLDRTCEAFGAAHVHRMFIVSPNPNLTFTDTIHS